MLTLKESQPWEAKSAYCECGERIIFSLHWNCMIADCKCGRSYKLLVGRDIAECCYLDKSKSMPQEVQFPRLLEGEWRHE